MDPINGLGNHINPKGGRKTAASSGLKSFVPSIKSYSQLSHTSDNRWPLIRKAFKLLTKEPDIKNSPYFIKAFTTPIFGETIPFEINLRKSGKDVFIPGIGLSGVSIASRKTYWEHLRLLMESTDKFGLNSAKQLPTKDESHRMIKLIYSITSGFSNYLLPLEERKPYYKFLYLLMFSVRLCAFSAVIEYLRSAYLKDVFGIASQIGDRKDLHYFFDLFAKFIVKVPHDFKSALYVLERAIYLQEISLRGIKDAKEKEKFFNFIKGQIDLLKQKYGKELKTNIILAAFIDYFDDLFRNNPARDQEYNMLISQLLTPEGLIKPQLFDDLENASRQLSESIENIGVLRVSRYSVELKQKELYDPTPAPFVTFNGSIGRPRNRESAFSGGNFLDISVREIDEFLKKALESRTVTYGIALRYDKQSPFWFIPVLKDGRVAEFLLAEMSRYYFAKNIEFKIE